MFAKYYDHVDNSRDISGISRFLSGGIGGISSQLSTFLPSLRSKTGFLYKYVRYISNRNHESERQMIDLAMTVLSFCRHK